MNGSGWRERVSTIWKSKEKQARKQTNKVIYVLMKFERCHGNKLVGGNQWADLVKEKKGQ